MLSTLSHPLSTPSGIHRDDGLHRVGVHRFRDRVADFDAVALLLVEKGGAELPLAVVFMIALLLLELPTPQ